MAYLIRGGNFYPINNLSADDIHATQEHIRKRVLRLFRAKGLLDPDAASDMLDWENSGFSLNANVRIEAYDREGLERLIRYCARPVFASERLDIMGDSLRYALPKAAPDGQTVMLLTPKELLNKLAQLIPPPKRHRHHYHGVLAPSSPLRRKVANNPSCEKSSSEKSLHLSSFMNQQPVPAAQEPIKKSSKPASLYRWALLMARIYEIQPLTCPKCTYHMRIISFIQDCPTIRKILNHIQEPSDPPSIAPARGPPEPDFNYDQSYEFA